jgi:two-component system, OmpR family, sensor histidine kinase ChvG
MIILRVLRRSMVRDTDLPKIEPEPTLTTPYARLRFGIASLTTRILVVNFLALALMAGAFFYLDSFRTRLVDARSADVQEDLATLVDALAIVSPKDNRALLVRYAARAQGRVRIYGSDGSKILDSFALAPPTYALVNPDNQPWARKAARNMDRAVDWMVGAPVPQAFVEPRSDNASAWPEVRKIRNGADSAQAYRYAPDRTPVFSAALPIGSSNQSLLLTTNARDITRTVRAERQRLGIALGLVLTASILLSLFLARTIVNPLQRLASAAVRVRLGRAREVIVPRLPSRHDELGQLARALSDMTHALRQRIDAGEDFAADVTHELKNPLASLRSSLDTLDTVQDPALRAQLMAIAQDDCRRLDRLVSDISEASRVDAQLSRAKFESIDLGKMIEAQIAARNARTDADGKTARIAFARPRALSACVMGDGSRLERVFDNLIDNALSFSPPAGVLRISVASADGDVVVRVEDEGPGVARDQREAIFRRFHTERPDTQAFGKHSGLGLAIARTIISGHQGSIMVTDRPDGAMGACFEVRLPATSPVTAL